MVCRLDKDLLAGWMKIFPRFEARINHAMPLHAAVRGYPDHVRTGICIKYKKEKIFPEFGGAFTPIQLIA